MPSLFDYMKETQRLTREGRQDLLNPEDIISHVNKARREIAMRSQCVRVLTPISDGIISASIVNAGSGYTSPSVSISGPDFPSGAQPFPNGDQATATATLSAGTISAVNISYGGHGYFQPHASIVDPTGTGASITLTVDHLNVFNQGQEQYLFSDIDLSTAPGAEAVYMVMSMNVIYANYRYSIPRYPFTQYQAYIRQYPHQYQYVPTFFSQYGQGTSGSLFVYPLPSQTYQFELDCFCLPQDLISDESVEILPDPWTDAVPYLAAAFGMASMQNYNAAKFYQGWYDEFAQRYSNYARPGHNVNVYGRY